ncbi:hypothetical protein [Pontibacter sp. HJ8]
MTITWKAKPDTEQLKDVYWQALQFVKTYRKICFYCTDISSIGPLTADQEAWLTKEYYPQVFESIQSDIYAAVIFSEDHFKALISNYVAGRILPRHDFIHFNYFTDLAEATDWLLFIQKSQDQALNAGS